MRQHFTTPYTDRNFSLEVLWLLLFTVVALWIQYVISGVDVLVIALIILLQEKHIWSAIISLLVFTILQEATGSLAFGLVIVWYASILGFIFLGALFFSVTSFSFVCLLAFTGTILKCILIYIYVALEGFDISLKLILYDGLWQFFIIPILWFPAYLGYKRCVRYGNSV